MHIAYLHYLYGRDTALQHVRQFAAAAEALGHRVDVHNMNLAPSETAPAGNGTGRPSLRGRARSFLKRHLSRYLHDPKELMWTLPYIRKELALLRRERPDVLLVRTQGLNASCVFVARRLGLPLVLEINGPSEELKNYSDAYLHLLAVRERLGTWRMRNAQAVTVVSSALKDYFATRRGIDPEKMVVVPNGADLELFHPDLPPDPAAAPRDEEEVVVGYVGSFQRWHGIELMAEMINAVGAARPQVRFLMVGDGPGLPALREATAALGERVRFTGRVEHSRVPGLVACLDIGVLAEAAFYQSPLKAVEWMAAGRAVVAPAYGPLIELMEDGVEGCLFPPGDGQALVRTVTELVDAPSRRRTLGAAAAARTRAALSWRHNAARVVAACEAAQARHRGAKAAND